MRVFKLMIFFGSFLLLIDSSFSQDAHQEAQVFCSNFCNSTGSAEAIFACVNGGGSQQFCEVNISSEYNSCMSTCVDRKSRADICGQRGGSITWVQTTTGMQSMCQPPTCENGNVASINQSSEVLEWVCNAPVEDFNAGEQCGADPREGANAFGGPTQQEIQNWLDCVPRAQIEQQRRENELQAQAQARVAAEEDLARNIEATRSSAITSCRSQTQSFISQCQSVSAQAPPNETINQRDAGSVERCRSLQRSSESVVSQVENQVSSCSRSYESLSSTCIGSTGSLTGTGSASVGEGATLAQAVDTAEGSGEILENTQLSSQASAIYADLDRLSSQIESEMRDLERQAEQCIAAFEQDPDNSEGNNFAGLAQTAAQAFGTLNDAGTSGALDSGELGSGSFKSSSAAQTPGFQGSNSNRGDSASSFSPGGTTGFNGGGEDFDQKLGDTRNPQGPRNTASNPNGRQGSPGGFGGAPGAGGGRAGGFGNNSNGNKANKQGRRRDFLSAKDRNLLLGYKKVKKGDSAVTYHPDDLKKIGKKAMLKKLADARKIHGDYPLIFKNGRFMRDLLEMQNRLAWQRQNQRMKDKMSGLTNKKPGDIFHDCYLFGECYAESRYNIFKLHHYRAIRHLKED